jgi:hypothetical protein
LYSFHAIALRASAIMPSVRSPAIRSKSTVTSAYRAFPEWMYTEPCR